MQVLSKKFAAFAAVAALGAGSLVFAAETHNPRHFRRDGALMQVLNDSQRRKPKRFSSRRGSRPSRSGSN